MARGWLVMLLVTVALAGCTSEPPKPIVTTTPPAPTATPFDLAALRRQVDAAGFGQKRMAAIGLPSPVYNSPAESPVALSMCDRGLASDAAFRAGHGWTWVNKTLYYSHFVFGYEAVTGAQAVREFRGRASSCTTYGFSDASGSGTIRIVGPVAMARPAGIDEMYAFAELAIQMSPAAHKNEQTHLCTAVLGKGQLMAYVRTLAATPDLARERLAMVVPVAAEALVAAVA